jgi:hypothetical protein
MFEQAFKNIDDVLWKEAGCMESEGGVQGTPEGFVPARRRW